MSTESNEPNPKSRGTSAGGNVEGTNAAGQNWSDADGWSAEDDWSVGGSGNDVFDRGWRYESDGASGSSDQGTRTSTTNDRSDRSERAQSSPTPPLPSSTQTQQRIGQTEPKKKRVRERDSVAYVEDPDYDLYDDEFPKPKRGRGCLAFLIVAALFAGAALLGLRWYQNQVDPPGVPGAKVEVTIKPNTSTAKIGKILNDKGVVGNATLFRFYAQFKGKGGFEAGKYEFQKNSSFNEALRVLNLGAQVPDTQKLTIPEGFRVSQIAERIGKNLPPRTDAKFQEIVNSGKIRSTYEPSETTTLEGFLFPSTYTVTLEDDEGTIATRMVEQFDQIADSVKLGDAKGKVGVTPYEALIVASLVEREAKLDIDRPKIARVIYNRLKTDRALQIDATLIYALGGGVDRVLLEDTKTDGPFNTYTRKGLPPTPIANPGRASLEAALNPEPGDWLYYVRTELDGGHSFAVTFKEHKKNIAIAKERGLRG
jgi:UPF0755 protein